jgi:hypothetical protein
MQTNRFGVPRNEDATSGSPARILQIGPSEVSALRDAIDAYMALDTSGRSCRILEDLYTLLASWERDDPG